MSFVGYSFFAIFANEIAQTGQNGVKEEENISDRSNRHNGNGRFA